MSTDQTLNSLFAEHLPDIIKNIRFYQETIFSQGWDSPAVADLYHLTHKLVGSSGVLGYQQISLAAKVIEEKIDPENGQFSETLTKEAFDGYINALLEAIQTDQSVLRELYKPVSKPQMGNVERASKLIYLFEDDAIQAFDLVGQIENYGYRVKVFDNLDLVEDVVRQRKPAAILMGIDFPEGRMAGPNKVADLRARGDFQIPVIFLSTSDHFSLRLSAVRAGGQAYFIKPVDIISLIDVLDRLTHSDQEEPYRILLIEDSKFQAVYYAQILENEGMKTMICTQPAKVLDIMSEFNPDLILLDMYMPDCSGMELANLVRQVERFVSIPIVYLSAEQDIDIQLRAMSHGGDDFLSKPIKPDHLFAAVKTRIIRYRKLRSFMLRDGLTGLLNHTTINEYLEQELARAQRQKTPLSFVMIDLDLFKQVNDNYGHPAGDRVLKSLSRLLKQRLRRADVVGRYGGEEFALILPDTPGDNARYVLEDIRRRFNKITHLAGDQFFSVSFSAGIASYPEYTTANDLKEAADQALYQSKHAGRDCVSLIRPALPEIYKAEK
jgi:diguanylate cyclase (GGDEF)-like protein